MTGWQPKTWSMVWGMSVGFTRVSVWGSASVSWSVKVRLAPDLTCTMPGLKCSVLEIPTLIPRVWPPLVTTVASPAPVGGGTTVVVVVVVSGAVVVVDSPVVVLDVDDDELLLVDDGSLVVVPAFDWAALRNTVPAMSALVHSAPARNLFVIAMPPMLCWWTCELGDIPPSVSPRPRTLRNVTP